MEIKRPRWSGLYGELEIERLIWRIRGLDGQSYMENTVLYEAYIENKRPIWRLRGLYRE